MLRNKLIFCLALLSLLMISSISYGKDSNEDDVKESISEETTQKEEKSKAEEVVKENKDNSQVEEKSKEGEEKKSKEGKEDKSKEGGKDKTNKTSKTDKKKEEAKKGEAQKGPKVELHGMVTYFFNWIDQMPIPAPELISPEPIQVPFDDNPAQRHSEFIWDNRLCRFDVRFTDQFKDIKVSGRIVTDFFTGTSDSVFVNAFHMRLRWFSARADLNPNWFFVIGQEDSLWITYEIAFPPTAEIEGFTGTWIGRHPLFLIGYQKPIKYDKKDYGKILARISAEKQAIARYPAEIAKFPCKEEGQGACLLYPTLVGSLAWYDWKPFQANITVMATQNRLIGNATINGLVNGRIYQSQDIAWGFSATWQSEYKGFVFYARLQMLNGLNHFQISFPDVAFDTRNMQLHNVRSWGWYAGMTYWFNDKYDAITFLGGTERAKNVPHSTFSGVQMGNGTVFMANFYHMFWKLEVEKKLLAKIESVVEFKRMDVWNFNHVHGHLNVVQGYIGFFF